MLRTLRPVEKLRIQEIENKPFAEKLRPLAESMGLSTLRPAISPKPLTISRQDDRYSQMSTFHKVLDIMGRPGYAVKSMLNEMTDEYKRDPEGFWQQNVETEEGRQIFKRRAKDLLDASWKGLSGEERVSADELWKNVGVDMPGIVDFATELATDPMMYGGYSLVTRAIGKGVGVAWRGAKSVPLISRGVAASGRAIQPVTSALKELFVNKTGLPKLAALIDKHLLKRQYLRGKEIQFGMKIRNVIQNIARKTGQSIDDVQKQIVNLIEQPGIVPPGAIPEARALANVIKSHLTSVLTAEMKAGVPISGLIPGAKGMGYFPRITTKEAVQYLKQAKIGNAKIWNVKLAHALKRRTRDFTLDEFNSFVAEHGLKSLGGKSVEQFFIQNPAYAVAIRGARSAKAVTSAQFLKDAGRLYGSTTAPSFWVELSDSVTRLTPSLKGLRFDPEVAAEITRVTTKYFNPQATSGFLRGFDAVQNLWKKWTLAPFPKYHLRNMVGNTWNNYLAGVNPKNYPKAQAVQMYRKYKFATGAKKEIVLANLRAVGLTPSNADDIIRGAETTGVFGRGWYAADIEQSIEAGWKAGFKRLPFWQKVKKLATGQIITEKGMAFGTTIENNARLAHFLHRLDKGDDVYKAAVSVKKFLFDYGDMTAFERQIMKRLFPFYTWTRKNIPLQLEKIWTQPEKFAVLSPLLRTRNADDLLRLKYARPDLYERLPIELKREVDTATYIPLEGLIPAGDLAKLPRPQEIFLELLTPYLRAPIELRMNKSFYFESEIQRYPKETQELLRIDMPVKVKYLLTTVLPQARLLNEINKLVRKEIKGEELTPLEQMFAQTLSSVYKVNLKDLRTRALQVLDRKMQELDWAAAWAKRHERPKEFERIKKTREELKKLLKQIK